MPLEYNFELFAGVAFNKGCYVGQELTARTHFRGQVNQRRPFRGHFRLFLDSPSRGLTRTHASVGQAIASVFVEPNAHSRARGDGQRCVCTRDEHAYPKNGVPLVLI
jgi:hypothetical protein